jgi:4-hydroxybenzoyl-CoA thioesterase
MAFVLSQRVRFQHCDPAGIVFYPRYFEMLNSTVEEWFADRLGTSFAEVHVAGGHAVPTVALRAEFRAPSRLGDLLDWRLTPHRIGGASLELGITAECDGRSRAEFVQTLVWIATASGRPQPWPDVLRARILTEIET